MTDDELPVLTHVLRTGAGRVVHAGGDASSDDFGVGARQEPSLHRALVIGSGPDDDPSIAATTNAVVADPRHVAAPDHDVFVATSPTDTAFTDSIDVPDLVDRRPNDDPVPPLVDPFSEIVPASTGGFRRPPSARVDAAFATDVRDAVLEQLASRIDTELDARIAQAIHAELETALGHLQARLRGELSEALRDVVGRAVDDAVLRLRPMSDGAAPR